jgi:hypothetical protein
MCPASMALTQDGLSSALADGSRVFRVAHVLTQEYRRTVAVDGAQHVDSAAQAVNGFAAGGDWRSGVFSASRLCQRARAYYGPQIVDAGLRRDSCWNCFDGF